MTTQETSATSRCSRRATICPVIDDHVVTTVLIPARPPPTTRTATFASRLETSIPAHRRCTTSTAIPPFTSTTTEGASRGGQGESEV